MRLDYPTIVPCTVSQPTSQANTILWSFAYLRSLFGSRYLSERFGELISLAKRWNHAKRKKSTRPNSKTVDQRSAITPSSRLHICTKLVVYVAEIYMLTANVRPCTREKSSADVGGKKGEHA